MGSRDPTKKCERTAEEQSLKKVAKADERKSKTSKGEEIMTPSIRTSLSTELLTSIESKSQMYFFSRARSSTSSFVTKPWKSFTFLFATCAVCA